MTLQGSLGHPCVVHVVRIPGFESTQSTNCVDLGISGTSVSRARDTFLSITMKIFFAPVASTRSRNRNRTYEHESQQKQSGFKSGEKYK